ncbi:MAG: glycosyltransferase family A protein [Conexivisphaerales archaeon]
MTGITYSICIINYNSFPIIEESLQAIFNYIDDRYEIVVVDGNSTDGSREILEKYAEKGLLRLYYQAKRCRGLARQMAFEKSKGDYIISQVDLDDVIGDFRPTIDFYHEHIEGKILVLRDFLIGPRDVIAQLGGWRNLNWGEDFDLWSRAAKAGKLVYVDKPTRVKIGQLLRKRKHGIPHNYYVYRDSFRMSKPVRSYWAEKSTFIKMAHISIATIAYLTFRFYEQYNDPFNRKFRLSDYSLDLYTDMSKKNRDIVYR